MPETREALLVKTFVALADSLVDDFDVIDLLQNLVDQSTELFDASDAGITLGSDDQDLSVVAATSEASRFVGLMQARAGEGPCVEAVTMGRVISIGRITDTRERWPAFVDAVVDSGAHYASVHAIPLRLRGQTIGSLNLFRTREGILNEADAVAAKALADVATISVLQERNIRRSSVLTDHLQFALDSRVVIEQAKGVLSHQHRIDMDEAYRLLQHHARETRTPLLKLAADVVESRTRLTRSRPPVG